MLFANENLDPVMLAAGFLKYVEEYKQYAGKVFKSAVLPINPRGSDSWKCPLVGWVKINTNVHFPGGCTIGLGVVIRDENDSLLVVAAKRSHANSPKCAKALAMRYALLLAQRLGFPRVWLESDAINVIHAVRMNDGGRAPINIIFDDIIKDSLSFVACNFTHIKRKCNIVAHLAAR
ncbi:uncharacterized protein LOC110709603 [Chenopodium quinoa]|uniref:uncharacterized protein LOC110709603 n=1 Tax=Chenopodium quinoa TaxID=63459 RepID=UPI000B76C0F1|nr:uncharacterized protein LOC110709603 [Chenopodium quinoa]